MVRICVKSIACDILVSKLRNKIKNIVFASSRSALLSEMGILILGEKRKPLKIRNWRHEYFNSSACMSNVAIQKVISDLYRKGGFDYLSRGFCYLIKSNLIRIKF